MSQPKILEILRDTVIESLEKGKKGERFPVLHSYLEMEGEDVNNETVKKLRQEFVQIQEALPTLNIGVYNEGKFIPMDYISGRTRMSNPDAGIILTSIGIPKEFPAREKLGEILRDSLDMCDEAIRRNCGFGKYTTA